MTDYAPRSSQDYNSFFSNPQLAMPQYSDSNGLSYLYGNSPVQYQAAGAPCSAYSQTFVPTQGTYMPTSGLGLQFPSANTRNLTLPSQSRTHPHPAYFTASSSNHRGPIHNQRLASPRDLNHMDGTECQDSTNEATMLSEPVEPPLDGYPNVHEFDELMKRYVQELSPKKQDKALIHARRAANIRHVLIDKKTTSIESAQFRFWVKKMFTLQPADGKMPEMRKICHEGKPVAVREKLFKILTRAHKQCQHGGRDKTSAQVRKVYSWVPKELISRFVKLCPTCQVRRGTNRNSPPTPDRSLEAATDGHSEEAAQASSMNSRALSTATGQTSLNVNLPLQTAGFKGSSTFQQQSRWMTPLQTQQAENHHVSPMSTASHLSSHDSYNTIPPMPMNCTNATPPGLFSSGNPFAHGHSHPSAYTSESLSRASHGHIPSNQPFELKAEHPYM